MLQFITHTTPRYTTIEGVRLALEGGCRWIQLRMKDTPKTEILKTAIMLKPLCWQFGATLLVDDHVDICQQADLDGVHLGKEDMDPTEARRILGSDKIIGGTANTYEDIRSLVHAGVDYIGLGPFRFTRTKQKLSPVLGLDGYAAIFRTCKEEGIQLPIIAIGGITRDDIPDIIRVGASGIALSSTILDADDPKEEMNAIINLLQ